jgi:hypothetical protein
MTEPSELAKRLRNGMPISQQDRDEAAAMVEELAGQAGAARCLSEADDATGSTVRRATLQ